MRYKTLYDAFISGLPCNPSTNDCWPWLGKRNYKDYGEFYFNGIRYRAHRFSYAVFNGPVPVGKYVCHICDNPCCVNPKHLFLGDASTNAIDAFKKNRRPQAKLNTEAVKVIKWYLKYRPKRGLALKLANLYGVGRSIISEIQNEHIWTFVKV